jgi:hypothetical protein
MADAVFPQSYKDPVYAQIDAQTESKLGLPAGLLSSIRTNGERSNHDQVSEDGARTVYQFIPATRKAILDKYGIDVTLNPENASEGAGLLLKESLDRNNGDPSAAVGEFHGGTDRANWGPRTKSYIKRVTGSTTDTPAAPAADTSPAAAAGPSSFDKLWASVNAPPTGSIANVLKAYQAGQMAPEDAKQFEADVQAGHVMLPQGASLAAPAPGGAKADASGAALPQGVVDAFDAGKITGKDREQLFSDINAGRVAAPDGSPLQLQALYPNRDYQNAVIPGRTVQRDERGRPYIDTTKRAAPAPGIVDQAVGAGEAGLNAATGLLSYPVALASEFKDYGSAALNAISPNPYDYSGVDPDANANAAGAAVTYQPRTPAGQAQAQALGQFVNDVAMPLAGAAPELAMLHGVAPAVGAQVRTAVTPAVDALRTAATGVPDIVRSAAGKVAATLGLGGEVAAADAPAAGTMGSVGAAGTDMATQRREAAASLPVPVKLTKGQESRSFEQLRFEQETAKSPSAGAPLRERFADQNAAIPQNFDRMIDMTGAEAVAPADVGRAVVDNGLVKDAAALKTKYRTQYREAEKAGETAAPVSLQPVIDHLNDTAGEEVTAPLLTTARNIAVKLGIAELGPDGKLVAPAPVAPKAVAPVRGGLYGESAPAPAAPAGTTLGTAERFRQAINRNTGIEPTNIRQATILKQLVDQATESAGGDLYKQARKTRQRYAQLYENNAVVSDLLRTRRGTSDRQIALENVFDRTIMNGSREDLSNLRRTLQVSGSDEGKQAWRELQGATVRWLQEESTRNVATDIRGNPIVSPARLHNAVRALESGGKLDFILGKKGAQQIRDLNDLVKVVYTSPPGSVNTSNTASVLLAAMAEAGLTGSLTGLPVPVLSGLRAIAIHVKDRRLQIQVQHALNNASSAKPAKSTPRGPMHKPPKSVH